MKHLYLLTSAEWIEKPREAQAKAPLVLAALQSLWHPALIADAEELPARRDLDNLPYAEDLVLAVVKSDLEASGQLIQKDFAELPGIKLIVDNDHVGFDGPRRLLEPLQLPSTDDELLLDFFAFGYAYHALDVLFTQMGHDNPVSQDAVYSSVQEAAQAFLEGQLEESRSLLRNSFEVLASGRSMVYPATISIVDLALAFPGMTADAIRTRSAKDSPINLILTGAELEEIAGQMPASDPIFSSAHGSKLEVLSGTYDSRPFALLPLGSRLWQLSRCMEVFEKHVGSTPSVFASRAHALTPDLPQLLMKFQYRYALHGAFDGGKFPHFRNPKLHWTARDGSVIEAIARAALNAGDPTAAFTVFAELGRTTMSDRAATLVLAHWMQEGAAWYEYLLRAHEYANVFGHFHTFDDFFMSSAMADRPTTTQLEEYASNALMLATARAEPNPISRWQDQYRRRGRLDAARSLAAMVAIGGGTVLAEAATVEDAVELGQARGEEALAALEVAAVRELENLIVGNEGGQGGYLIFNPCSFARRLCVELPGPADEIAAEHPVRAVQSVGRRAAAVVDCAGFGYTWIGRGQATDLQAQEKNDAPLASGRRLRNEFIEVEIDGKTGGIRGIWDVRDRYSRLGQQLAFGTGSKSICKRVEITASGPAFGEIVTEGEIRDTAGKEVLANFTQKVRLWIGRPVVDLSIQVDPVRVPAGDPREDYLACRWAWPDEKTALRAASGFSLEPIHGAEIESPQLIQLRERNIVTDIIMHGLPFHHRGGYRMLDTMLVTKGESQRDFHFTIGLNLAHPWSNIVDAFQPPIVHQVAKGTPANKSGWFARIADSNIVCFSMVPFEEHSRGVAMRFVETAGTATHTEIRFAQRPSVAELTDCRGQLIFGLHPTEEGLPVDFSQYELLQLKVLF